MKFDLNLNNVRRSGRFILETFHGSWVTVDMYSHQIYHGRRDSAPINYIFEIIEGIMKIDINQSNMKGNFDGIAVEDADISMIFSKNTYTVSIMYQDRFLTALPDGKLEFQALECANWECYSCIPLEEAINIQNTSRPPFPLLPLYKRKQTISKLIHQTYPTASMPDLYKNSINKLRLMNEEYSYKLWTDKDIIDFIYEFYGYEILSIFLRINPQYGASRADFFRYLCLYKLGGVYLDIKSTTTRPLNDLIRDDDEYLLAQWDCSTGFGIHKELSHVQQGEYQQWHIISAPGHPFLHAVICKVINNIVDADITYYGFGQRAALLLTGPIPYTLIINSILDQHRHRFIEKISDYLDYDSAWIHVNSYKKSYKISRMPIVL